MFLVKYLRANLFHFPQLNLGITLNIKLNHVIFVTMELEEKAVDDDEEEEQE